MTATVDVFKEICGAVTAKEVLERYGVHVTSRNTAKCPFHQDETPSLRVYPGSRGWWCFVCNVGGSVIDFAAKLFHLSKLEAARRIDTDFGLHLFGGPKPDSTALRALYRERERKERELTAYRKEYINKAAEARTLHMLAKARPGCGEPGEFGAKMGRMAYLDYWFSVHEWR